MRTVTLIAAMAMGLFLIIGLDSSPAQQKDAAVSFADVSAIFSKYHCTLCHGAAKASDGLILEGYDTLMKGSKHGPMVVPKDPGKSELIRRVKGLKEPRMPFGGPPWLTDGEIQTIEMWIAAGAPKG